MMDTIGEVSVSRRGARARRRWPDSEKRRIVAETLEPRASVSVVARRHDVNANQVFSWRRQYHEGLLGEEAGTTAMIPVEVGSEPADEAAVAAAPALSPPGLIEIALPAGIKVRVNGVVDGDTLQRVLVFLSRR
jgi:transposase